MAASVLRQRIQLPKRCVSVKLVRRAFAACGGCSCPSVVFRSRMRVIATVVLSSWVLVRHIRCSLHLQHAIFVPASAPNASSRTASFYTFPLESIYVHGDRLISNALETSHIPRFTGPLAQNRTYRPRETPLNGIPGGFTPNDSMYMLIRSYRQLEAQQTLRYTCKSRICPVYRIPWNGPRRFPPKRGKKTFSCSSYWNMHSQLYLDSFLPGIPFPVERPASPPPKGGESGYSSINTLVLECKSYSCEYVYQVKSEAHRTGQQCPITKVFTPKPRRCQIKSFQ